MPKCITSWWDASPPERDVSYSRKAVSCIWDIPLVLPCRMETSGSAAVMRVFVPAWVCWGALGSASVQSISALERFLTMEFCFEFLDFWGFLERTKRNFDLCDFDARPNRYFQLYFLCVFWEESQFIENTSAMKGEPSQDLPGILKVPYLSRDAWEGTGWLYVPPFMHSWPF